MNSRAATVILYCMLAVVWAIWAPVGFFLWIPLLLRTTIIFSGLVVHGAVTGQYSHAIRATLEAAIDFWFVGFRMAYATVLGSSYSPEQPATEQPSGIQLARVVVEMFWAAFVWLFGLWLFDPSFSNRVLALLSKLESASPSTLRLALIAMVLIGFIGGMLTERIRRQSGRPRYG